MSKRKYTHMNGYEAIILAMRQSGCTRRETADELGLSVKQTETWITRFNKRQAEKSVRLKVVQEKMESPRKNA